MDPEIHTLQLSDDPTNPELILEKLRILRELSKFARIDLNYQNFVVIQTIFITHVEF